VTVCYPQVILRENYLGCTLLAIHTVYVQGDYPGNHCIKYYCNFHIDAYLS